MSSTAISAPVETADSYELCSSGPVLVNYVPLSVGEEVRLSNRMAFQIQCGWTPLLCSTAQCFTKIICQSEAPVFVPRTVDVHLKGSSIVVYAPSSASLVKNGNCVVIEKKKKARIPSSGIVIIYAADMTEFEESVQAVISDNMEVYCEGRQKITVADGANVTIYRND